MRLYLAPAGVLTEDAGSAGADEYTYDPTVGTTVGFWCPSEPPAGLAGDQRIDDARSLTYETAPLAESLEILGVPRLVLHASSTAPVAFFCARLCDVAPDGASTLITRGALNATRRRTQRHPEPLQPGEVYELTIDMRVISWVVPAGHRLRLSVASAEWPLLWPSPYPAANAVHHGGDRPSRVELPVVGPADPSLPAPRLREPEPAAHTARTEAGRSYWETLRDEVTGATTVRHGQQSTTSPVIPVDDPYGGTIVVRSESDYEATVAPERPEHACVKGTVRWAIDQSGAVTEAISRASMRSTVDTLHVEIELDVTRAGAPFWRRRWEEAIPRNLL
jgi:hypothetical protein